MRHSGDSASAPTAIKRAHALAALILGVATCVTSVPCATGATDNGALRKKCAHQVKVKLGVKETGSVKDLQGVSGAVQMVDQCVANGGKI